MSCSKIMMEKGRKFSVKQTFYVLKCVSIRNSILDKMEEFTSGLEMMNVNPTDISANHNSSKLTF